MDRQKLLSYPNRILVFGSRNFGDETLFHIKLVQVLRKHYIAEGDVKEVNQSIAFISGAARTGADRMIINWSRYYGFHCEEFPADWDRYKHEGGKNPAGMIRNKEMADYATHGVSFWDGQSPGTRDMREHLIERDCALDEFTFSHEHIKG